MAATASAVQLAAAAAANVTQTARGFEGTKFSWTYDIALDNPVIFRTEVEKPGWTPRWNTKPDLDVSGVPIK